VDERCNIWHFFVEVPMANADILAAADAWQADLMTFQER
jgi:hypothetical protein